MSPLESVLVSGFVAIILAAFCTATATSPIIEGKSFSVRSKLAGYFHGYKTFVSQLHESYSVGQKRAKIHYNLIQRFRTEDGEDFESPPDVGTLFLDSSRSTALVFDEATSECRRSSVYELVKLVYSNTQVPEDSEVAESFIFGPARLLLLVEKHRSTGQGLGGAGYIVRNLATFAYKFQHQISPDEKVHVSAYYSLQSPSIGLPVRINIIYTWGTLMIDYSMFELLEPSPLTNDDNYHELADNPDVRLDQFAFPLNSKCSEAEARPLYAYKEPEETRFSFRAQVDYDGTGANQQFHSSKHFVAFDGALNMLRFETTARLYGMSAQLRILSFGTNRVYHVMESYADTHAMAFEDRDHDDEPQCMVARLLPETKPNTAAAHSFSIRELLVGLNEFVLMGRAQVRGVEAYVYEAQNASLPVWLEPPVQYNEAPASQEEKAASSGKEESSDRRNREPSVASNTLIVYIGAKDTLDHPLLLIELYKMRDPLDRRQYIKQSVHIHEFGWELSQAPGGDRIQELFSLEDFCSVAVGSAQENDFIESAQIELLLENDQPLKLTSSDASALYTVASQRDLSILASLQKSFFLPATMIFDIESKLLTHAGLLENRHLMADERGVVGQHAMMVTFRLAEHANNLVELERVGRLSEQFYRNARAKMFVHSFQDCLFSVAHWRKNMYLGYDSYRRICYIYTEKNINEDDVSKNKDAKLPISGPSTTTNQVFFLRHSVDRKAGHLIKDTANAIRKFKLTGTKLRLKNIKSDGDLEYLVKMVRVNNEVNVNSDNFGDETRGSKIVGFGLLEGQPQNRCLQPARLNSSYRASSQDLQQVESLMTYEQCHAACLTDIGCNSFSICIRDGQVQCILSRVSFKQPRMLEQLKQASNSVNRTSYGLKTKVTIIADNQLSVELIRHPNCQIYNKNFIQLFDGQKQDFDSFLERIVYAVKSREECAEMCFKHNIDALRSDVGNATEVRDAFVAAKSNSIEELQQTISRHKEAMAQTCDEFLYLERSQLSGLPHALEAEEQLRGVAINWKQVSGSQQIDGYCGWGLKGETRDEAKFMRTTSKRFVRSKYFDVEKYAFKGDIFYEKRYGVKLKASSMTEEMRETYRMMRLHGERVTEAAYSIMKAAVQRGDNFQEVVAASEASKCATICFRYKILGPWPTCRSYDVIVDLASERKTARVGCVLNSITLRQALANKRQDLIETLATNNTKRFQYWHYDPRLGYGLDEESKLEEALVMEEESLLAQDIETHGNFKLLAVIPLLITLIAIHSGLFIGLKLGSRIIAIRRSTVQRRFPTDQEMLVEPSITSIESVCRQSFDHVV